MWINPQVQDLKKLVFHKDDEKPQYLYFFFQSSEKVFFLPVATSQMAPVIVRRVFLANVGL